MLKMWYYNGRGARNVVIHGSWCYKFDATEVVMLQTDSGFGIIEISVEVIQMYRCYRSRGATEM